MAFSARILYAKVCSVVPLPALYAACSTGMLLSTLSPILLIRHIARTFLSMESRIIGLRFDSGPLGFPGFCSGVKMPSFISLGYSPVFDISFKILAISFGVSSPPYLSCSALISSPPGLLLFFMDLMAFPTSSAVNGGDISFAGISLMFLRFSSLKVLSKCFAIRSACSLGSDVRPSFPCTSSGVFFSLFAMVLRL